MCTGATEGLRHRLPFPRGFFGTQRSGSSTLCADYHCSVPWMTRTPVHMLTTGRPCLGRRVSIALDTAAAGNEDPLLFLYPRWAASAVQQRRPIASLALRAVPKKSNRVPLSLGTSNNPSVFTCPPSISQNSTRWHSSTTSSRSIDNTPDGHPSPLNSDGPEPNEGKHGNEAVVSSNYPGSSSQLQVESDESSAHVPHFRNRLNIPRSVLREKRKAGQRGVESRKGKPLKPASQSKKNLQQMLSVRDRKKIRYGAHLKQNKSDIFSHAMSNKWEDMMYLIEEVEGTTRKHPKRSARQRELFIPEETVAALSGIMDTSMRENLWYMQLRNGCKVQILPPREGDGVNRKVILTGSERTTELIKGRFQRIQTLQASGDPLTDVIKPQVPICVTKKNAPTIRAVWDFSQRNTPPSLKSVVDSRPPLTTVKEFAEYVEDLTNAYGPPEQGAKVLSKSKVVQSGNHIAMHLQALFQDVTHRPVLSTAALNRALNFLCDRDQLKATRLVLSRGLHVATADTYNIFLRSAGRRQDIASFRRVLKMMSTANVSPNTHTWLVLLETLVTPSAKVSLITRMAQKGLLTEVEVIRSALQMAIQDSLYMHLQKGQSIESFFAAMKKTHGADWCNSTLLGQMFSVLSRMKNFDGVHELLAICARESYEVDAICFSQVLPMYRSSIRAALNYLTEFAKFPSFKFVPQVWERLFLIAFKARRYNVCRVLWRYACLEQSVTFKMKQCVLCTLSRNSSHKATNQMNELWDINAGKVFVGLDQNIGGSLLTKSTLAKLPSEYQENPLLFLASGFKTAGEERDLQLSIANEIINRDIFYAPKYESVNSVFIMLEAAARMDDQWKGVPRPLHWVLQNAIQVPVKRCKTDRR